MRHPALRVTWYQPTPRAEPRLIISKVDSSGLVIDLEITTEEAEYLAALLATNALTKGVMNAKP